MINPPPVAPVVTDDMVEAAILAYDHQCEHFDTETQDALDMHTSAMRAAITAALEANGELERLRAELGRLQEAIHVKGGSEHAPTMDAYEAADKAVWKHREENERLRAALNAAEEKQCASCRHCDSFGLSAALQGDAP